MFHSFLKISLTVSVVVIFTLFNLCTSISSEYQENDDSSVIEGMYNDNLLDCPQFFQGISWPHIKDYENRGIVRLCQTQKHKNGVGKSVFATAFSTKDHIPVYTANVVRLLRNGSENPRPNNKYWERVVTTLCGITQLPTFPISSDIAFVNDSFKASCKQYQAITEDYQYNGMNLDRGHLSPNSINSQDSEKQYGTFTLTNAAPQFANFNRNSWREYECVTQQAILDLVPGELVYILTGTDGTAGWMKNPGQDQDENPVKIPKYYWKAVCYPGNSSQGKSAWGYAIVKENVNEKNHADYQSYITLKEFAKAHFVDPPFGAECMNASFGLFADIFHVWDEYLNHHCKAPWSKDEF